MTTITVNIYPDWTVNWDGTNNVVDVNYRVSNQYRPINIGPYPIQFILGTPEDALNGVFETPEDGAAYYSAIAMSNVVSSLNGIGDGNTYVPGDVVTMAEPQETAIAEAEESAEISIVNAKAEDAQDDANQAQSEVDALETVVAGKAASSHTHTAGQVSGLATVATSGSYNDLSNKPSIPTLPSRTFNNPTRSLNSAFQIHASQDSIVSYSVDIAASLSLTGGQAGTVYLRYADDSGITTNVKEVCRFAASNTGTLTIGLALNQVATGTLSGLIPAGKYAILVTQNNTGTPTFTYRNAQEVLLG